jgi:hypothetical protein
MATEKNAGVRKIPKEVTPIIPAKTVHGEKCGKAA